MTHTWKIGERIPERLWQVVWMQTCKTGRKRKRINSFASLMEAQHYKTWLKENGHELLSFTEYKKRQEL